MLADKEFSQVLVIGVARKLGQAKRHEGDLNDLLLDQRQHVVGALGDEVLQKVIEKLQAVLLELLVL